MRYSLIAIFLGTSSLLALPPVQAAPGDPGWQIGGAAAFSQYDVDDPSFDDSSMGFKLFSQYRFNALVGIEAAWLSTGDFEADISPGDPAGKLEASVRGFSLNLVGYLPWSPGDVDLFGKAGFYTFDQDVTLDGVNQPQEKADGFTAGLGAQIAFADDFALRLEGDWFSLDGGDLWTINLGLAYHFGAP